MSAWNDPKSENAWEPQPDAVHSLEFKQALLSQTTAVVRSRRRFRQAKMVALVAAVYCAGMGTEYLRQNTFDRDSIVAESKAGSDQPDVTKTNHVVGNEPGLDERTRKRKEWAVSVGETLGKFENAVVIITDRKPAKKKRPATASPKETDPKIEEPEPSQYQILASQSDQLLKQQDLPGAVELYNQSLQFASQDELEISPDDSWLLMSLKLDRQKNRKAAESDNGSNQQKSEKPDSELRGELDWKRGEDV